MDEKFFAEASTQEVELSTGFRLRRREPAAPGSGTPGVMIELWASRVL